MIWNRVIFFVCLFGFLKEFRPSESFISPYLNGHWKNFTESEINQDIYPVATYSNLVSLVVVFLIADWMKYKPIILMEGVAGVVTWTLLPLGHSITLLQIAQFFYGLFCATEVAYYSYLYSKVEKRYYQRATSLTKSTLLMGKASSSLISQVLVLFNVLDYHQLNYLTLGAMVLGTICAAFLPAVDKYTYDNTLKQNKFIVEHEMEECETRKLSTFVPETDSGEKVTSAHIPISSPTFVDKKKLPFFNPFFKLVKELHNLMKNKPIVKWSIWWALSLCGYLQVTYYMQLLWQSIINKDKVDQEIYHGFSNCINCLVGAIATYLIGFLKLKWDIYGEIALAFCALFQGSLLLYSAHISNLITGYFLYMLYRVLYQMSTTIASSEIARNMKTEGYALVFGISTLIALISQSFLTAVVIDLLKLNIKTQFIIYGNYYVAIGVGFIIGGILTLINNSV